MQLRKYIENFQDVSYNFQMIDRLLHGHGLDGDYIREVPAFKVSGSLQADQLVVGSTTLFEEGYDPRYVAGEAKAYTDTELSNLGTLAWEDAVEKAMLGATVIQGGYIVTGMIDASRIDTGTLNADRIAARSITTDKITIGGVTYDNLASNSVDGSKIMTNSIVAGHIISGEITAAKIAAGAITADKLYVGSVSKDKLGTDVISGGYLVTGLIDTNALIARKVEARDTANVTRIAMGGSYYNYYELRFYDQFANYCGLVSAANDQMTIFSPSSSRMVIGQNVYFSSTAIVDFQSCTVRNLNVSATAKFG